MGSPKYVTEEKWLKMGSRKSVTEEKWANRNVCLKKWEKKSAVNRKKITEKKGYLQISMNTKTDTT